MPTQRELTAYHEAGHAYAAFEMGLSCIIQYVSIDDDGRGMMAYFDCDKRPARYAKGMDSSAAFANLELVVNLAGVIGEGIAAGQSDPEPDWSANPHDAESVSRYSRIVGEATGQRQAEVVDEAYQFTVDMLREGWPVVQRLADALLAQGELSGFEVADICAGSPLGPLAGIL